VSKTLIDLWLMTAATAKSPDARGVLAAKASVIQSQICSHSTSTFDYFLLKE
jgi:hypothetical protein